MKFAQRANAPSAAIATRRVVPSALKMAARLATAFEQHYYRTSDQPNDYEYMLQRDKELSYEWNRHGDDVVYAIQNAAEIPEDAAQDVQPILEEEHSDFDSAAMGEETEFARDSYYQEKKVSDDALREEWYRFENSLKTEARFFSRTAATHLAAIFDGVDALRRRQGQPLVVDAGPGTPFHTLSRARSSSPRTNSRWRCVGPTSSSGRRQRWWLRQVA